MTRRQDIQGIRTVGALLVAAYHIWWGGVSGGVDVFFVLAGYFLASNFRQQGYAAGVMPVLDHWLRFLTRVAPQAIVALLGILLIGFFFTSPARWTAFLRDFVFSALYLENWWLIAQRVNYLSRDDDLTLTQHFWAVAIIGQVYLLWPVVAMLPAALARRLRLPVAGTVTAVIAVLALASFAWSLIMTAQSPGAAYFHLFTRFWEFAAGALLGLAPGFRLPERLWRPLSWLGLVLLLTCGFAVGQTGAFPGYVALWPVAAAVLLVLCGREQDAANASRLLALPVLSRFGSIAFGIYLWHWPLMVVAREIEGAWPLSIGMGIGVIVAATLLAAAGQWLADASARLLQARIGARPAAFGFAASLVLLAGFATASERLIEYRGAALDRVALLTGRDGIRPGPFSVRNDLPDSYDRGCHQNITSPRVLTCEDGPPGGPAIVVVGGSHSAHWLPAMQAAGVAGGYRVISMTKSACLFADPSDAALFAREHPSCAAWNRNAMEEIRRMRPAYVVTVATRGDGLPPGYESYFRQLGEAGIPVIAIRDTPPQQRNIPTCVFSPWVRDPDSCASPRAAVLNEARFAAAAARMPQGVELVDMTDRLCGEARCDAVRDGLLIYRDSHHLTATYARHLAPTLWQRATGQAMAGGAAPR
jgi:peptidoglycan/LPS O-acetylase OafA/YrhL